jgi:hypothetical protein
MLVPPSEHERKKLNRIAMLVLILVVTLLTTALVFQRNGTVQPDALFTGVATIVIGLIGNGMYIPF